MIKLPEDITEELGRQNIPRLRELTALPARFTSTAVYRSVSQGIARRTMGVNALKAILPAGRRYTAYSSSNGAKQKKMTLSDYFNYCDSGATVGDYYLKDVPATAEVYKKLFKAHKMDLLTGNLLGQARGTWLDCLRWFYVGKQFTYSGFHYDIINSAAWNYLFTGKKLWLFMQSGRRLRPDALMRYTRMALGGHYRLGGKCRFCLQEPGDLVFVESDTPHMVINLSHSISFTENFVNSDNLKDVMKRLGRLNMKEELKVFKTIEAQIHERYKV